MTRHEGVSHCDQTSSVGSQTGWYGQTRCLDMLRRKNHCRQQIAAQNSRNM